MAKKATSAKTKTTVSAPKASARAKKTANRELPPIPKSPQRIWVEEEMAAMERGFAKAMESPESALAFLVRAGIATPKGKLAKPYR